MRLAPLLLLLALGCHDPERPERLVTRAQFGIFFGGQVQERQQLPLEVEKTRQKQGLHLEFARPLPRDTRVSWELDMPRRDGKGRVTKLDEVTVPAGRELFDHELEFEPGDPLGTYNLRVIVDGLVVIDRPFQLVDPHPRPPPAAPKDAGR
jgi:hypothetical protein